MRIAENDHLEIMIDTVDPGRVKRNAATQLYSAALCMADCLELLTIEDLEQMAQEITESELPNDARAERYRNSIIATIETELKRRRAMRAH